MDFATIMKYLEQGFTLEQIEQMKTANEKNTAQAASGTGAQAASGTGAQAASGTGAQAASDTGAQAASDTGAQAASDNAAPAWVDGLSKSIEKLTMTMQAQALANTSINAPKDIQAQADEILANIINPTNKKE